MTTFLERMREATNLTRSGRLAEATDFIQRLLNGSDERGEPGGVVIDHEPEPAQPAARHPDARDSRPGPQGRADRFLAGSFANAAGGRPYKLFVPAGYDGRPAPLVVMLHGCTQAPDDFAAGTRMNARAGDRGCLVLYPEQTCAANAQRCWNWFNKADQQRGAGEPAIIAGMTRRIMAEYEVDPQRVFVAGLSAGGAAAAVLGATHPDLYAAVGVHSGLAAGAASDLSSAFSAMRQGRAGPALGAAAVPAIVFHGTRDTTVSPLNADEIAAQARTAGPLRATSRSGSQGGRAFVRTVFADDAGRTVVEQWSVEGLGHAWSGGSAAGSYADPLGPDASAEMLRFFLDHPRR